MAAVLVAGPGAALSHRSAAALWGLRPSAGTWIEVTAPRQVRSHRGMKPHRRSLLADEVTEIRGIPVTTVPRTLLDLAAVLPRHQVERAMNEAEVRRLTDALSAPALLARYPGWRGVAVIRAILEHGPFTDASGHRQKAGFSLAEFAIRCPARGQMGGGGVTMLGGSYSYSCNHGRLTISR